MNVSISTIENLHACWWLLETEADTKKDANGLMENGIFGISMGTREASPIARMA
jgi:hypothetical protein